ncbi:MAG: hypothetical protein KW793_02780 [Candidatus Doudnabacteria bacterium]|nr:hypothetical protein [Candidatus Doudnabacteria bacterium]
MKFVWGIIWVVVGILIMRYNFQLVNIFGKMGWAESYLSGGFGGTYLMYKLIGLLVVILALFYMFGSMETIVGPLLPVFGGSK